MTPTFTVLIGSKGRASLGRTLKAMRDQGLIPGDQVIVCFDDYEMSSDFLHGCIELTESYGPAFVALSHTGINRADGDPISGQKVIPGPYTKTGAPKIVLPGEPYHWLGVEQINHAIRTIPITGSHVFTIGDDDAFRPGAYDDLRRECEKDPLAPILFRFIPPNHGAPLWDLPRLRPCLISGCCIAAPAAFVGLMHTRIETTHDYDWIVDVLNSARRIAQREPVWLDYVGVVARPDGPWRPEWFYAPRVVAQVEGGAWT